MNELDTVRPLGTVEPADDETLARVRAELDSLIAAAPRHTERRWSRPRTGVLLVAAAAATAAAIALPTLLPARSGQPGAGGSAAAFLRDVAVAAGRQPAGSASTAPYWYSEARYSLPGSAPGTYRIWQGHHSSGRYEGDPSGSGSLPTYGAFSQLASGSPLSWDGLWKLPTDPDALAKALLPKVVGIEGKPGSATGLDIADDLMFQNLERLLAESPAPPALRAAIFEVLARIPRVQLVGDVTDSAGRRGVAVQRNDGTLVSRFVIDPATGRLLEIDRLLPPAPADHGYGTPSPSQSVVTPGSPTAGSSGYPSASSSIPTASITGSSSASGSGRPSDSSSTASSASTTDHPTASSSGRPTASSSGYPAASSSGSPSVGNSTYPSASVASGVVGSPGSTYWANNLGTPLSFTLADLTVFGYRLTSGTAAHYTETFVNSGPVQRIGQVPSAHQ